MMGKRTLPRYSLPLPHVDVVIGFGEASCGVKWTLSLGGGGGRESVRLCLLCKPPVAAVLGIVRQRQKRVFRRHSATVPGYFMTRTRTGLPLTWKPGGFMFLSERPPTAASCKEGTERVRDKSKPCSSIKFGLPHLITQCRKKEATYGKTCTPCSVDCVQHSEKRANALLKAHTEAASSNDI